MKKLFLLFFLAPFLMATQCEDDDGSSGFQTTYIVQNDSSSNLFLLSGGDVFTQLERQTSITIGSKLNRTTDPILPSESFLFSDIKLYTMDEGNFILVYEQNPIDDVLWIFNEPFENRFDYTLIITDDLIE